MMDQALTSQPYTVQNAENKVEVCYQLQNVELSQGEVILQELKG